MTKNYIQESSIFAKFFINIFFFQSSLLFALYLLFILLRNNSINMEGILIISALLIFWYWFPARLKKLRKIYGIKTTPSEIKKKIKQNTLIKVHVGYLAQFVSSRESQYQEIEDWYTKINLNLPSKNRKLMQSLLPRIRAVVFIFENDIKILDIDDIEMFYPFFSVNRFLRTVEQKGINVHAL